MSQKQKGSKETVMNNYKPTKQKKLDKFLETYSLPGLNHEKITSWYRLVMEIESEIKNLPTKKSQEPDGFTNQIFKNKLTLILLKLLQKTEQERMI